MSNINFPAGSDIIINGLANKDLLYSGLILDDDTLSFQIDKNKFFGELKILETTNFEIVNAKILD